MATKSGEMREMLLSIIEGVKKGDIDTNQANAIAKLTAQVNQSLKVEVEARQQFIDRGGMPDAMGSMLIGEEAA